MSEAKKEVADKPIGYECRFAVYCPPPQGSDDDYHLVKEIAHYADGRKEPRTRLVKNFARPFWVTKKGCRNHEQKKEWEELNKLDKFEATQSKLNDAIKKALDMRWFQGDPRQLSRSPYLYGSDILSTAVMKKTYQKKWPNLQTPYTVACFDTEKDVVYGTDEINMATISFGSKVFTAVQKAFVEGLSDVQDRAHATFKKYLGAIDMKMKKGKPNSDGEPTVVDVVEMRGLQWELVIVESEIDVIVECMKKAHQWKPDFVAIWNIDFDMGMMIKACDKAGYDPAHLFSDPSMPHDWRHFKYKQGQKQKKTASGKITPIKPADQWHTVYTPSSFYFIDAMCVYRKIRIAKGEEPSYALDAILDKILGARKLKFKEAEQYTKLEWHQFMQQNFKLEYIVYNVFDCVSMEMLDETTLDLAVALPGGAGCSDFGNFKSQPRRTVDDLHYFAMDEKGLVIGSTSDEMQTELDSLTLGLENWIVTLPAHLVADNGLQLIEEYPLLRTNIRVHVADLDVSASYPNGEVVFNIGKCTTRKELCSVEGVPEQLQRAQGINLSGGHTNAVEFCVDMYKLPHMESWLREFKQHNDMPLIEDVTDEEMEFISSLIRSGEGSPTSSVRVQMTTGVTMTMGGEHREINPNGWIDMTDVDTESDLAGVLFSPVDTMEA
jgi:hypothetical protein